MKRLQIWAAILVVSISPAAWGGIFNEGAWSSGFANGGNIPDGSTAGWSDTRNVSDVTSGLAIGGVTVTFTISGGFNGDLYAYLSHNGVLVPLLNRVGTGTGPNTSPTYYFGYSDAGFNNVTLADGGTGGNIHNYGGGSVPTGTYSPDSGGLTFSGAYGGINPDGNWTLFFADLSAGGGQSELLNWSLSINAVPVPEPVNVALGIFGGLVLVVIVARSRPVRDRVHRWRVAFVHWVDAV
jgi:hypothetical protein